MEAGRPGFSDRVARRLHFAHEGARLWADYLPLARRDVLAASLALNLTSLALPLVVLQVYDRIIPHRAFSTLSLLIVGLLLALILDAVLRMARSLIAGWAGAQYEHAAGMQAVARILKADLDSIEAVPAGKHLDRLSSIDPVRDFYASQASLALVDIPFAVLFLGLLGLIAGSLVIVPTLLMVVFAAAALWVGHHLRQALAARSMLDDRRYNFIIEVLSGIRTVKALAMERLMQRRYERLMESCAGAGHDVGYWSGIAQGVGALFGQATMVIVASIGSLYVIDGRISVGALAACTLLAGRTVQPVLRALGIWTRFQSIRIAEGQLAEVSALAPETGTDGHRPPAPPIETLCLANAQVHFAGAAAPVLDAVDLTVARGRLIAIQGRNGSGKSTLLWALMAGVPLSRGQVLLNGQAAALFDLASMRRQIAYLPQRAVLFQGTVLDNLTGFAGHDHEEEALRLAAVLGLDAVFARLPDGFETIVGNSAVNTIAAGVTQRIAMVRALVRRPRVILFDEANSGLDMAADERLKHLLLAAREDAGVVMVTHRPSLLRVADEIHELRDGRLATLAPAPRREGAMP
ncbi:MAG: peptidase domain-containing ABC transporter [Pseudomonadota bacterium]